MQQTYQTEPLPLNNLQATKAEILNLLNLKRCIVEYETNGVARDSNSMIPIPKQSQIVDFPADKIKKRRKHHRKMHTKVTTEGRMDQKNKTQSERLFKHRQVIQQNKKQLLRISQNYNHHRPKIQTTQSPIKHNSKYRSIQHLGKQRTKQNMHKRAETISHVKLYNRNKQMNEAGFNNNLETRLKTVATQYKSNYHIERVKMKEVDEQHRNIQQIVNQLTFDQFQMAEQKDEIIATRKITNKTAQIQRKTFQIFRSVRKQQPVKGLLKERYMVVKRIGKGLSGQVYKGKDILSDRLVAIKVSEVGQSKQSQYQFYKKIQHKNIVSYLNNFTQNGKRYLILEYFPHTLESLSKTRKFSQQQIKKIFKSIVSAIMFLHGMSIAHRDIKLDNIVCSDDLTVVKLIDFGLCVDMNQEGNHLSRQFCGTMHYIAPEILQKKQYQPRKADLWSLGILLYKLSFDRFPFRGKDQFQLLNRIIKTKLVFSQYCNEDLKNLLEKMLVRLPSTRIGVGEVMEHRWMV